MMCEVASVDVCGSGDAKILILLLSRINECVPALAHYPFYAFD
jgi:hypothetical protein